MPLMENIRLMIPAIVLMPSSGGIINSITANSIIIIPVNTLVTLPSLVILRRLSYQSSEIAHSLESLFPEIN